MEALHHAGGMVRVLHAQRGSQPEEVPLDAFMVRCEPYFGWGGCIIDQAFQPRLPEGMIRCYMSGKRVAPFVNATNQCASRRVAAVIAAADTVVDAIFSDR